MMHRSAIKAIIGSLVYFFSCSSIKAKWDAVSGPPALNWKFPHSLSSPWKGFPGGQISLQEFSKRFTKFLFGLSFNGVTLA